MARTEPARYSSYRVVPLSNSEGRRFSIGNILAIDKPQWCLFFAGVLFGRALLLGELLPFGVAFFAALRVHNKRHKLLWPFLGILVGTATLSAQASVFPYVLALIGLWLVPDPARSEQRKQKHWFNWAFLSFAVLRGGSGFIFYGAPFSLILGVLEGILCVVAFSLLIPLVRQSAEHKLAHKELQFILLLISAVGGLDVTILGFPLRFLVVFYLALAAAKLGGVQLGAVVTGGLAVLLLLLGVPASLGTLVVGVGVLAGLLGKFLAGLLFGGVAAFLVSNGLPIEPDNIPYLIMIVCGVALVHLTPRQYLRSLERIIPGTALYKERQASHHERVKELMVRRIKEFSNVFQELASTLSGCEPDVSPQLSRLADLVGELGSEFKSDAVFAEAVEEKLLQLIGNQEVHQLTAVEGLDGCEIYGCRYKPCTDKNWCKQVALHCNKVIGLPYEVSTRACEKDIDTCEFRVLPKPRYGLEVYTAKLAREGISGDSNGMVQLSSGKTALLLSDGMGVGERANEESSATIALLEKMIQAGYDKDLAIRLINQALLLREGEESFATIDLTVVDLQRGHLEFVKIGSAPSFIKRGTEVEIIHNRNLPVGILQQVDVEPDRRLLREGEYLIMITDGILEAQRHITLKEKWMMRMLRRIDPDLDCEEVAHSILAQSLEATGGSVTDDMMVLVARLVKQDHEIYPYRGHN